MKKCTALCCILALCFALTACGETAPANVAPSNQSIIALPETDEPEKALEEIYKSIDSMGILEGTGTALEDKFFIDLDLLDDFYFNYSTGRFGVADVFLLKPAEGQMLQVRELLEQVKLSRIKEFENYDVYNAHQIAQDAQIFEQGEYVVMLMLPDNETARAIVDKYIPKT